MADNRRRWRRFISKAKLMLCFALWIGLFGLGLMMDSKPFRQELLSPRIAPDSLYRGVADFVTWIDPATLPEPRHTPSRAQWHLSLDAVLIFALAFLAFTPTNLAMLCCLAAVLGSVGRRLAQRGSLPADPLEPDNGSSFPSDARIASSLLRGFCVYLLVISGLIVLTGSPFDAPTQDAYIRLAGAASILSFVAGYRTDFFPTGLKHLSGQH